MEAPRPQCHAACCRSSWGGLPLKGPDGRYHLFASQFVNNCTLGGWNPGSTVVRAVADTPHGPFTYAETVFPTFHHNPTVRKLSAGKQSGESTPTYVMLMIGDNVKPKPSKGAACSERQGRKDAPPLDVHHLEGYIKMAWAKSLLGPWSSSRHNMYAIHATRPRCQLRR